MRRVWGARGLGRGGVGGWRAARGEGTGEVGIPGEAAGTAPGRRGPRGQGAQGGPGTRGWAGLAHLRHGVRSRGDPWPSCVAGGTRRELGTAPRPFPLPDPPPGDGFWPSLASLPERKGLGRKHVSVPPSGCSRVSASRSHWLVSRAQGVGSPRLVSPD